MPAIELSALEALLTSAPPPVLLDVRLPEDYAEAHLPGAVNACVFEVAFPQRAAELAPDRARSVVVYGAAAASLES
ncbi:MAG TPA: rhodanese-like domain-containing protein, partial [Verrucomicrobiota bacterium]|nr:rhodanese-like domain-containing protein [Verrucomicrobiota bacterium]